MLGGLKACKKVFRNPNVEWSGKRLVVNSYRLSRGIYQSGTWPVMSELEFQNFSTRIFQVYRTATDNNFHPKRPERILLQDEPLLEECGFPAPSPLLRVARIQLLITLWSKGPASVCKLLSPSLLDGCGAGWSNAVLMGFGSVDYFVP